MGERGRIWIALTVISGHVLVTLMLMRAMQPQPHSATHAETMMVIELIQPPSVQSESDAPAERDTAEMESATDAQDISRAEPPAVLPQRTIRPRVASSEPMQAVIAEPPPADADDVPEPAQWRLPPSADVFARAPDGEAEPQGFGRREQSRLPSVTRPRIAGEPPVNPIIPEQRMTRIGAREVVHAIGTLIGGGPNAPVEAPCGGRVSGGGNVAQGFSPAWNKHYGCSEDRDPTAFDGTAQQPPGTVR